MNDEEGVFFPKAAGWLYYPAVKKAKDIAKQYDFPIGGDVTELIKKMGGRVDLGNDIWGETSHFRNFEKFDNEPLPKDPKNKFIICIAEHEYDLHENYIQAQLLGHYVLHSDGIRKMYAPYSVDEYHFTFPNEASTEAGYFAFNLLSPRKPFIEKWEGFHEDMTLADKVKEMEHTFSAPEFVIDFGLKYYGLE